MRSKLTFQSVAFAAFVLLCLAEIDPVVGQSKSFIDTGDSYVCSLALDQNLLLVGLCKEDIVEVYEQSGDSWFRTEVLSSVVEGVEFGASVALRAGVAVIGAPGDGSVGVLGKGFVYRREAAGWSVLADLECEGLIEERQCGSYVALSGGQAFVSSLLIPPSPCSRDCDTKGRLYVFDEVASGVPTKSVLSTGNTASLDADDSAAVHSAFPDGSGHSRVVIFERLGGGWAPVTSFSKKYQAPRNDTSVSVSGDWALVGARDPDTTFVLRRDGGAWAESSVLQPGGPGTAIDNTLAVSGFTSLTLRTLQGQDWVMATEISSENTANPFLAYRVAIADSVVAVKGMSQGVYVIDLNGSLPPPSPEFPYDGSVDVPLDPTLQWSQVPSAVGYRVIMTMLDENSTVLDTTMMSTSLDIPGLQPLTKYRWQVASRSWARVESWSMPVDFTTASGVSSFPVTGSVEIFDLWETRNQDGRLLRIVHEPTIELVIADADRNQDAGTVDTVVVTLGSPSNTVELSLPETTAFSGIFAASVGLLEDSGSAGRYDVVVGPWDTLTVSYLDPQDDFGSPRHVNDSAIYFNSTPVSGTVPGGIMRESESPFLVTGDIRGTLTIEPGVTVLFLNDWDDQGGGWSSGSEIRPGIATRLTARGTNPDSIVFRPAVEDGSSSWGGITLQPRNTSLEGATRISHCVIVGAETAIRILGPSSTPVYVFVEDNRISSGDEGIVGRERLTFTTLRNRITDLSGEALDLSLSRARYSIESNVIRHTAGVVLSDASFGTFSTNDVSHTNGVGLVITDTYRALVDRSTISTAANSAVRVVNSGAVISNNLITANSSSGVEIFASSDSASMQDSLASNSISGNAGDGLVGRGLAQIVARDNNIFDNGGFEVRSTLQSGEVDVKENWWGSQLTAEIESASNPRDISGFFDVYDDPSVGFVNYARWRTGEAPTVAGIPPEIPLPSSPPHGAEVESNNVVLTWAPARKATGYRVEVSGTDDFVEVIDSKEDIMLTEHVFGSETPRNYYWRVRSTNQVSRSLWSETRMFSLTEQVGLELGTLPRSYSLSQNYPNPANPTTTISYDLPNAADATLTVYDVLGREVRELASGTKPAGTYEVSFDTGGLPSGIYFYRLQSGDYVETKRMVVVK